MNLKLNDKNKIFEFIQITQKNINIEMETIFFPINNLNKLSINSQQFADCYKRLEYLYGKSTENPSILDIILPQKDDCRISLIGIESIKKYYKSNILDLDKIEIICKKPVKNLNTFYKNIDIKDYNIRIKIKDEILIKNVKDINKVIENLENENKLFRYKKRYSFITTDQLFRFDLTIIKTSPKNKNNQHNTYKKLSESNTLNQVESHEIELEYIGNKSDNLKLSDQEIFDKINKYIIEILQVLNKNSYIISDSEKYNVLNNYIKVIDPKININSDDFKNKKYFIGPKPVSIKINNIKNFDEHQNKYKDIISIRKGYSVTEKSDGERCLIFIDNDKKVYLINDRMDVKYTNQKVEEYSNCILDGEHISKTKDGDNINHILIFDIYFKDNKDLRKIPFVYLKDKTKLGRYHEAKEIFKKTTSSPYDYQFIVKEFKIDKNDYANDKIFELSKIVWEKAIQDSKYCVDGLIYTPLDPISDIFSKKINNNFYSSSTCDKIIKWKPSEDNTIDFLVKIIKDDNSKLDKVSHIVQDSKLKKYKTLILYTGFNPSMNYNHDPCKMIFTDFEEINSKNKSGYFPKEFQPRDEDEYLANIFLEMKDGKEVLTTIKNDGEIKDNMIVEMSYDITKEKNWRWIPRNIRYDKTEMSRLPNSNMFGNDFNTALNIWNTYYSPITKNILFNQEIIPENYQDNSDLYYYTQENVSRKDSNTYNLRKFHNYIKNQLITLSCSCFKDTKVLDLGCGQFGDLFKFNDNNVSTLLGIDIFNNNLIEACKRYYNEKKISNNIFEAYLIHGDIGKNILNQDYVNQSDNCYKNISKLLFGIENSYTENNRIKNNLFGLFKNGFNLLNIQFVIHYLFENKNKLDNLITNIKENIQTNGLFIGTTYDGHLVFDLLSNKSINEYEYGYNNDKSSVIWRIKKLYNDKDFNNNESSLGLKISVIMDSIGTENEEYLVNFEYFNQLMNDSGLYLLNKEECEQFNLPVGKDGFSTGFFKDWYEENLKGNANYILSKDEKEISFLNRWFIFKKKDLFITNEKVKIIKKKNNLK